MDQYSKRRTSDISGLLVAWVFLVGLSILFFISKIAAGFLLVLIPITIIITGKLLEAIIDKYLIGKISYIIQVIIVKFAWGAAAFCFFYKFPNSPSINKGSYFILILVFLRICFKLTEMIDKNILLSALSRAFIYLFEGIVIKIMSQIIWKDGIWNFGIGISFANIMLFGYIILFLCTLLSVLELSSNRYLKASGKWFGKSPNFKLVIATVLGFLMIDIRAHILQSFAQMYEFIEWMIFGGILVLAFFVIYSKVSNSVDRMPYEELGKHAQSVMYYKGDELKNLTKYIDEFVREGKKANLLVYIVLAADGLGISLNNTNKIITPLLGYNNKYEPWLKLRSEVEMVNERNMKIRNMIMEKIVSDIGDYNRR